MRRLLHATLLILLFNTGAALAEVRTMLEPRLIDEMETVRLTLRVAGTAQVEAPDFSPLEKDFELLGTKNSSRISSINGRTTAVIEYQVTLRPRRTGQLKVPALKLGDEYSEELEVAVRPMDPAVRASIAEMIFFESELLTNPVYVQAQSVLVRKLYYSDGVQIYSDLPGIPELPNAVVVPLGDTSSTISVRNGRRYGVIEQRFAIFPEQSGSLTIPSISVTSSVRLQSGGRTRRSGIRVATEELNLEVLPIPESYPADQPWLPAEAVTLKAAWDPQRDRYDTGEPVKLQITAQVVGNVSSALPPLSLDLPQQRFKIYPEAPDLREDNSGDRVIGHRDRTFALIPTMPGPVDIPAINLTWWDTRAEQVRQATVPSRSLQITGEPPPQPKTETPVVQPPADNEPQTDRIQPQSLLTPGLYLGIGIVMLLVLAVLGYRFVPLPAAMRIRWHRRNARRQTRKALSASCHRGDLHQIKLDLAAYLSEIFECPPSQALERFRQSPQAAQLLRELDQALYSPEASSGGFDASSLLALARQAQPGRTQPSRELPALYS